MQPLFSAAACIQPSTPSLYRAGASSHLLRLAKFHTITTAVATAFDAVPSIVFRTFVSQGPVPVAGASSVS